MPCKLWEVSTVMVRLGVKPCLCVAALVLTSATLSGCASAPISMQSETSGSLMLAQVELRQQADDLARRLDEAGWSLTATPAEATRSFFGRLIGGADTVEETAADPVETYMAELSIIQVNDDLVGLVAETRTLADQALLVASADGNIESGALERDIAAVERALGAVRRAEGFFETVADQDQWSTTDQAALLVGLEGLEQVEARLAASADALAERRWATRSGLFG